MSALSVRALLAVCLMFVFTSAVRAEDAATVTGTWTSSWKGPDGTEHTTTFKLKQEGDKITGTASGRNGSDTEIEDGSLRDGQVSFSVTREFNNNKMTIKYEGKLDGDTIKGTSERPGRNGGDPVKRDWTATRQK